MSSDSSPLRLEAETSVPGGVFLVVARLRNTGVAPCSVVVHEDVCRIEGRLRTMSGELLKFRNTRSGPQYCMRSVRPWASPVTIAPGDARSLRTFFIADGEAQTNPGFQVWDLRGVVGETLTLDFVYAFSKAARDREERQGYYGLPVGEWVSPAVEVPVPKEHPGNPRGRRRL